MPFGFQHLRAIIRVLNRLQGLLLRLQAFDFESQSYPSSSYTTDKSDTATAQKGEFLLPCSSMSQRRQPHEISERLSRSSGMPPPPAVGWESPVEPSQALYPGHEGRRLKRFELVG
eukprot:scaffold7536_cov228-Skeletonema_dohrnii-CCMP3373.AAC.2